MEHGGNRNYVEVGRISVAQVIGTDAVGPIIERPSDLDIPTAIGLLTVAADLLRQEQLAAWTEETVEA